MSKLGSFRDPKTRGVVKVSTYSRSFGSRNTISTGVTLERRRTRGIHVSSLAEMWHHADICVDTEYISMHYIQESQWYEIKGWGGVKRAVDVDDWLDDRLLSAIMLLYKKSPIAPPVGFLHEGSF